MPTCPPGTRARGSWGERTRSPGSRPCSQSATAGDAGTLLLDGTAGVGTTRFIDEAIRRVAALQRADDRAPRRAPSVRARDAPYAPLVRALRPALAALPDDELADVMGRATDELLRLLPELAHASALLVPMATARADDRARASPGAPARGHPRRPRPPRASAGRPSSSSRTSTAPTPARAPSPRSSPASRGSQRLAIVGTYQADAIRRDDPWAIDLRCARRRPAPARPP